MEINKKTIIELKLNTYEIMECYYRYGVDLYDGYIGDNILTQDILKVFDLSDEEINYVLSIDQIIIVELFTDALYVKFGKMSVQGDALYEEGFIIFKLDQDLDKQLSNLDIDLKSDSIMPYSEIKYIIKTRNSNTYTGQYNDMIMATCDSEENIETQLIRSFDKSIGR